MTTNRLTMPCHARNLGGASCACMRTSVAMLVLSVCLCWCAVPRVALAAVVDDEGAGAAVGSDIAGCSRLGIGVLSKSDNIRLRMAVRRTWFRQLGGGIVAR
jgi:hypothetical protein